MRVSERGITAVEVAIAFALVGSLLAIAIPTFARELHASRFAEPVDGLARMSASAIAGSQEKDVVDAFPPSAPLTPAVPPRGTEELDPPGTWDGATWRALAFRASPEGVPHRFSFAFDRTEHTPQRSAFVAIAHGDLNGNGVTSTFEVRGHDVAGDALGAAMDPGMYVDAEVE